MTRIGLPVLHRVSFYSTLGHKDRALLAIHLEPATGEYRLSGERHCAPKSTTHQEAPREIGF